jgi:hypothetical protein
MGQSSLRDEMSFRFVLPALKGRAKFTGRYATDDAIASDLFQASLRDEMGSETLVPGR